MKKKGALLYYVTAGWGLFVVAAGLYFLSTAMKPTADVVANLQYGPRVIPLEGWEPGKARTLIIDEKPIVIWHRDPAEIATALSQMSPDVSSDQWLQFVRSINGESVSAELRQEFYSRVQWFVVSPINVGGHGCISAAQAGDYGGFFDPCQNVHFDMWGRRMKGPTEEHLLVPPYRFTEYGLNIVVDLSEMPSIR